MREGASGGNCLGWAPRVYPLSGRDFRGYDKIWKARDNKIMLRLIKQLTHVGFKDNRFVTGVGI